MRGLGMKLLTALNPLDQSMAQQIMKATAGKGLISRGFEFAKAGGKQIASGGYFSGINRGAEGTGWGGSGLVRAGGRQLTKDYARTRTTVAGIGAAWAGLNYLAPESSLTTLANYGVAGAATYAVGSDLQKKFGNRGRNLLYGGVGGVMGANMFGLI